MHIKELYQELIIDHGTSPRNFKILECANYQANGYNPLCGDNIKIFLLITNNLIKEITFHGSGCAISIASASIMTDLLINKSIDEANSLFKEFINLLTINDYQPNNINTTKILALSGIKKFPGRIKCATLAWHTFQSAINKH